LYDNNVRLAFGLIAIAVFAQTPPPPAIVQERTHVSQVTGTNRVYQVLLPPAYAKSQKKYPVLYWLQGYEQPDPARDAAIANYVASHDVIVVRAGPVETTGAFPLYFGELADQVDRNFHTVSDRDHRGVAGIGLAGYMALWTAGEFPDIVSSASSLMGPTEASVGPSNLDVESRLDDLYANYDAVRTRVVMSPNGSLPFYQQRLNSIFILATPAHQSESSAEIANTLDFHLRSFASPMPKPAQFRHVDVFPNFTIWRWEVLSNRRQPGFTVLENAGAQGFRSAVRESLPSGPVLSDVKLSITSAPLFTAGSPHSVAYIRLRDGKTRRVTQKADAQGRLNFELDGEAYEVGLSAEPAIAISGYELVDAAWATAGSPVKLRLKIWNKGAARAASTLLQWESPNSGVKIEPASTRLVALGPGESTVAPVTITVADATRPLVKLLAVNGTSRLPLEIPLFPPAPVERDYRISDGRKVNAFQHGTESSELTFGEGNGDAHAAPGESFALLLPDSEGWRAAELFTNDACVDNSMRASDSWDGYDHSGASARYSLPAVRKECQPGHVMHFLARILVPHGTAPEVRYRSVEVPVWWRPGEEPK
jgi:hypothetical protein